MKANITVEGSAEDILQLISLAVSTGLSTSFEANDIPQLPPPPRRRKAITLFNPGDRVKVVRWREVYRRELNSCGRVKTSRRVAAGSSVDVLWDDNTESTIAGSCLAKV